MRNTIILAFLVLLTGCSGGSSRKRNFPPEASVTTPSSIVGGVVSIDFVLSDRESDPVDIQAEFSTDSGADWAPATLDSFVTTGLATSRTGLSYVLPWDSAADGVGIALPIPTVQIRITPFDPVQGISGTTGDFTVDNLALNQRPVATLTTPVGVVGGTVSIPMTISDAESNDVVVVINVSTDSGATWSVANTGGWPGIPLATSPTGLLHTIPWDSVADGVGLAGPVGGIRIQVTPSDFPPLLNGAPAETGDFTVDNTPRFAFVVHLDPGDRDISVFRIDPGTGGLQETPASPFPLTVSGNPFGTWSLLRLDDRMIVPYWMTVGNIGVYDIDPLTGDLAQVPVSPTLTGGEYCRSVAYGDGRIFAVNMGTTDISVFDYDLPTGGLTLTPSSPFPTGGTQPIRITYGDGRIFCTNTTGTHSITVMDVDPTTGDLTHTTTSPVPFTAPGSILYDSGRLFVTRDWSFVTDIHVYDVDPTTGALNPVVGSPFPATGSGDARMILAGGRIYLTHFDSNELGIFDLDATTGALTENAISPFATGSGPWGVAYQPERLFLTNRNDDTISVYNIDPPTGNLTEVAGSPFGSGGLDTSEIVLLP